MWPTRQEIADLITFTEEIRNWKLFKDQAKFESQKANKLKKPKQTGSPVENEKLSNYI